MKKFLTKVIAVFLVVLMAAVYVPVTQLDTAFSMEASAYTKDGSLGGNIKWSYDTKTKVITVSGSGAMKDFKNATDGQGFDTIFWGQYPNKAATKIVINEGVTYIGQNAFRSLTGVKEVSIPSSVTSIGKSAFEGCSALTTVNLTESLTSIGAYAFKSTKFASVKMPYSVKTVGEYAFANVSGLNITCNYGDAAYTYCKTYGAAYTLRNPSVVCETSIDTAKKQVLLTLKLQDASGFNAANFTVTYSEALKPVSTDYKVDDFDKASDVKTAVVYNKNGEISVASLSQTCIPYASCGDKCSYTIATLAFTVNGQADTAQIVVTPKAVMANDSRISVNAATANIDLHSYEQTGTTAATCKDEGTNVYTCSLCGKVKNEPTAKDPSNHVGGTQLRNAVAATCTEKGYSGDTVCLGCGEVLTVGAEIDILPHSYVAGETVEPTCTSTGYTTYTCSVCGDSYVGDETETTAHDYVAGETVAPTCSEKGYTVYTCAVCGDSYHGDETETTAHDYVAVVTAPTCQSKGCTTYTCSVCGDSYVGDETEMTAHQYAAGKTVAPTCTAKGYTVYQCKVCGASYNGDEVPAAHQYKKVVTAPTCKSKGYTTYTCSVCGDSYKADETKAVDHDYVAVVTEPTCTQAGYTIFTCSMCKESYKGNVVSALGHDYGEDGVCKRCGNVSVVGISFRDGSPYKADEEAGIIISSALSTAKDLKDAIQSGSWTLTKADGTQLADADALVTGSVLKNDSGKTYQIVILGDVNYDGKVSAQDARQALRYSAKLEKLEPIQIAAANCDGEGDVTAKDARLILRVSAKLETFN